MTNIESSLIRRRYVVAGEKNKNSVYFNAMLLVNFGIVLDKPEFASEKIVKDISEIFRLYVPKSFYENPQHTRYYSCSELLLEQVVSYFLVESGTGIYDRIPLFEKELPQYKVGNDINLREFKVITESEVKGILTEILDNYCAYTRPFGADELAEFVTLFTMEGLYSGAEICCRDNVISMLKYDYTLARFLDKKDLVKYSISVAGDRANISFDRDTVALLRNVIPFVRDCPLSKKQAKYFNTILKKVGFKAPQETNVKSPYKYAVAALKNNNVLEAARIYAKSGSLLERNLVNLLSKANPVEAVEILNMVPAKNPIALYQLTSTLMSNDMNARTFTFTKNGKVKHHNETEYEARWRKSRLNESFKTLVHDTCFNKIVDYYKGLPSLGKVYIADNFYKIGVPTNTSAGGIGIDVLPAGSRIKCTAENIRTFVYWDHAFDIDASLILVRESGKTDFIYFGNYAGKPFGNAVLFSGDCRASSGAEYYDIKLADLKKLGYKYAIQAFHGYMSRLDSGEIYCGYQNKSDLETTAWDPKNIAMQFRVFGDSRACVGFAIDLDTNEVVMLNQILDSEENVVSGSNKDAMMKYLADSCLELNIGLIASNRGEIVNSPEEADVVFDDSYAPTENQSVIRSYELEKLVKFVNE